MGRKAGVNRRAGEFLDGHGVGHGDTGADPAKAVVHSSDTLPIILSAAGSKKVKARMGFRDGYRGWGDIQRGFVPAEVIDVVDDRVGQVVLTQFEREVMDSVARCLDWEVHVSPVGVGGGQFIIS